MATRFDSNEAAGEKLLFFGAFHCKKPNDFAFHIGDKLLIKKLVSVVKSKTQNDDYEHFQLDEKKGKRIIKSNETIQTSFGTFFGTNQSPDRVSSIHSTINEESLVESLYQKSSELIRLLGSKKVVPQLTKEMCSVQIKGQAVKGFVKCSHCQKQLQVYFDQTYFVLSNLKKHLIKCDKIKENNTSELDGNKTIHEAAHFTPASRSNTRHSSVKSEVTCAAKQNVTQSMLSMQNKTNAPNRTKKATVSTPEASAVVAAGAFTPAIGAAKAITQANVAAANNTHHKSPKSTEAARLPPTPKIVASKLDKSGEDHSATDSIMDDSVVIINIPDQNSNENERQILSQSMMEISPLDAEESAIYFQLCAQTRAMRSISLQYEENEIDIPISIEGSTCNSIVTALIDADGDCLISAIAHQLERHKLDSESHDSLKVKLRESAVEYIQQNLNTFANEIIWRDDFDEVAIGVDTAQKINSFLDKLSKAGFWCGTETIVAISRLYSVNKIIFNGSGTCYTVEPFNFNYQNCALLAYCAYQTNPRKKKRKTVDIVRNHYNSITKIDKNVLFMCMKKILTKTTETQYNETLE